MKRYLICALIVIVLCLLVGIGYIVCWGVQRAQYALASNHLHIIGYELARQIQRQDRLPRSPDDVRELLRDVKVWGKSPLADRWGKPLRIRTQASEEGVEVMFSSCGWNGVWDDGDDVSIGTVYSNAFLERAKSKVGHRAEIQKEEQ